MKKRKIISVITGDIINSRKVDTRQWLRELKKVLLTEGETPSTWEIFRGDSFQLEVKDPGRSLYMAIKIKATIRRIKGLDVRMAIGIGEKGFKAQKITESNGEAFINSGEKLETLKKEKQSLALKTPWSDFDEEMNLCIKLALVVMDNWPVKNAELVRLLLDDPTLIQSKLASRLKISQAAISGRLKRSLYADILALNTLYSKKIKSKIALVR
ncbi:MAG TPA: SatD family protein [Ohtaekwangia sp.]|nr:SatD family protein [Ohtaekwangia sp.]